MKRITQRPFVAALAAAVMGCGAFGVAASSAAAAPSVTAWNFFGASAMSGTGFSPGGSYMYGAEWLNDGDTYLRQTLGTVPSSGTFSVSVPVATENYVKDCNNTVLFYAYDWKQAKWANYELYVTCPWG